MSASAQRRSRGRIRSWALAACASLVLFAAGCGGSGTPSASIKVPPATFDVVTTGLPNTSTVFSVHMAADDLAYFLISDFSATAQNGVIVSSPIDGTTTSMVALPQITYPAATAMRRSDGPSVAGITVSAQSPNAALLAGSKLFVTSANFDLGTFAMNPGTVLVYDVVGRDLLNPRSIILDDTGLGGTGLYNPGAMFPINTPSGDRLAVVVGDSAFSASSTAAIVTIDPATETIDQILRVPGRSLNVGSAALASDQTLYVGSSRSADLFVFDLNGAAPVSAAGSPVAITTSVTTTSQDLSAVVLSGDEASLFVGNRNDASLTVLDRIALTEAQQFTDFRRSVTDRNANGFDNQIQSVLLRPGTVDDLRVGIIGIRSAADQVVANVQTAVDAATGSATGQVILNAVSPPPFTANGGFRGEIQQLFAHPSVTGFYFVVEAGGTVHAVSF